MRTENGPADIPALSDRERRLISLHLGQPMAEDDIRFLTEGLDIDRCGQPELLMLSCVGYEQGWEQFPGRMVPRLKGIHQYHQVHNTIRLPWLLGKIRALRREGIPVMLLKGLAMRFHYAEGIPRIMGDYDVAVPEACYDEAIRLLQREGETYLGNAPWLYHGQIAGRDRCLEVHSWIFKHHGELGTDIWERAIPCDFFGEDVTVLCPDDMLLHLMDNRARDMFENIFPERTAIFLCDCRRVIEAAGCFDLARLAARARELHTANSARRMLFLLADCFPDLLSRWDVDSVLPETAEYRRWLDAGVKLRRATDRWRSYRYQEGGAVTPLRLVRMTARHYALARMKKVEMNQMGYRYSFALYCRQMLRAGGGHVLAGRADRPAADGQRA